MRFIRELNPETRKLLRRIILDSKFFQTRERAQCIILSDRGFSIPELMKIFSVSRKTIYNWFTQWEDRKLIGLYNQKRRGLKSQFNFEQKTQIRAWAKSNPQTLYIPYGWQGKNETIVLKSSHSKRINVVGLMNRENELYYEICSDKIDSEFVFSSLILLIKRIPCILNS